MSSLSSFIPAILFFFCHRLEEQELPQWDTEHGDSHARTYFRVCSRHAAFLHERIHTPDYDRHSYIPQIYISLCLSLLCVYSHYCAPHKRTLHVSLPTLHRFFRQPFRFFLLSLSLFHSYSLSLSLSLSLSHSFFFLPPTIGIAAE